MNEKELIEKWQLRTLGEIVDDDEIVEIVKDSFKCGQESKRGEKNEETSNICK